MIQNLFSGYVTCLGECLVTWKCKKQATVALSTCEAEVGALLDLTKELKWLQGFLAELNEFGCLKYPLCVKTDSQSAISVIGNSNAHGRTKHFRRSYTFVKDEVERGNLKLVFVPSSENQADVLTKNVHGVQMTDCMKTLNVKHVDVK